MLDRWWSRLDEWHHVHAPRHPVASTVWRTLWRPLCNYAEYRYQRT